MDTTLGLMGKDLPSTLTSEISARAYGLGSRIDVAPWAEGPALDRSPLVLLVGRGICVVFRTGGVVFFGVEPEAISAFIAKAQPHVADATGDPEIEEALVRVRPDARLAVSDGVIVTPRIDVGTLQIIAVVLARSVALAHYEESVTDAVEALAPAVAGLACEGEPRQRERELAKRLGRALLAQHEMTGRIEVGEKPELLWEREDLERLYLRLADFYELAERDRALDRKLQLVRDAASTLLDLGQNRRSLRLELYIVVLIVVEIGLMLVEWLFRSGPG